MAFGILKAYLRFFVILLLITISTEQSPLFWNVQATNDLNDALYLQNNLIRKPAKNVIFFLGDGMGVTTVTAARILQGQLKGETGEENILSYEYFPHVGLSKTYNTDYQSPDSAGTATAFFSGVKTKSGMVGVDDTAEYSNCSSALNANVQSVLELAIAQGRSTGIVSTARITHATPAATYSHVPNRSWESDRDLTEEAVENGCKDIASQLIDRPEINVILGGGRREFFPETNPDPEDETETGDRRDGRNLIDEWKALHTENSAYVWNNTEFSAVDPESTDYLFGLFESSHMQYEAVRARDLAGEPSISEMTEKAIRILRRNTKGYFLAIEGGRVDHAHHSNSAYLALHDAVALAEAVQVAIDMTDEEDTLIIVTADHSHAFALAGYSERGHPILGLSQTTGVDGLPFTSAGYLNGPGGFQTLTSFTLNGQRVNLTDVDTDSETFINQALVPLTSETHGAEDVAIYASGPFAHLIHGVHEQNYIAHVMKYAACIGDGRMACTDPLPTPEPCNSSNFIYVNHVSMILALVSSCIFGQL